MIPKILHFIWFGHIPPYVKYTISNFQRMNPTFRINFINDDTASSYENIYMLKYNVRHCTGKYQETIKYYKDLGRSDQQILSNILRLDLLNVFGGIYLDCDCMPIRPFDNELLAKSFIVNKHYNENYVGRDCYFMGRNADDKSEFISYQTAEAIDLLQTTKNWQSNILFIMNKLKFKRHQLKLGQWSLSSKFYIEHYNLQEWKHDTH